LKDLIAKTFFFNFDSCFILANSKHKKNSASCTKMRLPNFM